MFKLCYQDKININDEKNRRFYKIISKLFAYFYFFLYNRVDECYIKAFLYKIFNV